MDDSMTNGKTGKQFTTIYVYSLYGNININ